MASLRPQTIIISSTSSWMAEKFQGHDLKFQGHDFKLAIWDELMADDDPKPGPLECKPGPLEWKAARAQSREAGLKKVGKRWSK